MPSSTGLVVVDDRLLIEELLVGLPRGRSATLHSTFHWYYRACRAAVLGAGGQLSGPLQQLRRDEQELAILSLLELRSDIVLPDVRTIVPHMARIAKRHPRLNLLTLEAVAAGQLLAATLWLSSEAASGVLPGILEQERVAWRSVTISPR